jgi:uncharacterized protein (TIGR00369 family)
MSDEVLAKWIAEEREVLDRVDAGPGAGVAALEQLAGKSGLEVMTTMLMGTMPIAHMAEHLTFCAIAADQGVAVFQGAPQRQHLNPMGTVHGGWIATVMDSALGSAVLTELPPGYGYTTSDLSVKYLRPLTINVARVRAEATVVARKDRAAFAEARMVGPDGTLYAQAKAECRIFPPRPR